MTDGEIKAVADRVVGPHLLKLGLDHIEVRIEYDDPEMPVLVVEAFMKPGSNAVGGKVVSAAHSDLSQSLVSSGEGRFPYFRVRYPDEESLMDVVGDG